MRLSRIFLNSNKNLTGDILDGRVYFKTKDKQVLPSQYKRQMQQNKKTL